MKSRQTYLIIVICHALSEYLIINFLNCLKSYKTRLDWIKCRKLIFFCITNIYTVVIEKKVSFRNNVCLRFKKTFLEYALILLRFPQDPLMIYKFHDI